MQTSVEPIATSGGASVSRVLVLLCGDAEDKASRSDIQDVSAWLSAHHEDLRVLIQDGPCPNSQGVRTALEGFDAQRLVLGFCSSTWPETEVQAVVRRAGLDPLGIQAVNIGSCRSRADGSASARARLLLAAAIAHARAFQGSRPENLKATLARGQQRISRRALFTLPPITYVPVPTISATSCAAAAQCAECVRACPSGALRKADNIISVERSKCLSCGACVEACPQRAVEFPGCSAEEFEAHLDALLRTDAGVTGRAILFMCGNDRAPVEDGWLPMRVPCVVMVPTAALLQSLAAGATTVGMRPCGPECPASADEIVRGRVDYCQQLLRLLGESPERVRVLGPEVNPFPGQGPAPAVVAEGRFLEPVSLFGRGAAARAVTALAAAHGDKSLVLDHAYSPLGLVRIDTRACTACGNCAAGCPSGALTLDNRGGRMALEFDASLCSGCNNCAALCPESRAGAITMTRTTNVSRLSAGPDVLIEDTEVRCNACGAPVASRRMLERLAAILEAAGHGARVIEPLCDDCKGIPRAIA